MYFPKLITLALDKNIVRLRMRLKMSYTFVVQHNSHAAATMVG